LYDGT